MSATDTHADETTEPLPGPTRLRPNQIAIVVGIVIAVVVALSGVASAVFQFHDDSPIQREVFDNIPGPQARHHAEEREAPPGEAACGALHADAAA